MPGLVAVLDPVAVLEPDLTHGVDQERPERFVTLVERRAGQIDAAAQERQVGLALAHSRSARRLGGDGFGRRGGTSG